MYFPPPPPEKEWGWSFQGLSPFLFLVGGWDDKLAGSARRLPFRNVQLARCIREILDSAARARHLVGLE